MAKVTCVESLLEFLNFVGGARFSVYSFSVEAMHLNVVDKLLHDQGHRSLVVGQARNFHSKLSGGELWIKLFEDTNIMYSDTLCRDTQTHAHNNKDQYFKILTKTGNVSKIKSRLNIAF